MTNKYIPFTNEQKEQAHQTDLAALLQSRGETIKRSGHEYEWCDGSQKVTIRGNLWFHQYERIGGDTISFVRRFYNMSYPEAISYLLNQSGVQIVAASSSTPEYQKKSFELPERNDNMRRVYAYLLLHRRLDREVIDTFTRYGMLYESAGYHNAVFVGYDKSVVPLHAHKRGTGSESTFKCNAVGSDPRYSFHWHGTSERLYLFEAPIDMLSFISMNKVGWNQHSYAAACSVSDQVLFQMLKDNPNIKSVSLCLDNDEAGQSANKRIADKLQTQGISYEILVPNRKDWNEDLLYQKTEREMVKTSCQVSVL